MFLWIFLMIGQFRKLAEELYDSTDFDREQDKAFGRSKSTTSGADSINIESNRD
jgi:hypothetical protein